MRSMRQWGCVLAVIMVVASTLGCRSGNGIAQTDPTDQAASIADAAVNPQFYNAGPQTLPMRSDKSYASDVVSIAKKDPLVTHTPPSPMAEQGPRAIRN